jgi:hypothetical protein
MVVLAQRMISGGMALASGLILGFIFSSGALGMLLTGPLSENYGFPTVLVMTTGLVLLASPLAWMLKEKTEVGRVSKVVAIEPSEGFEHRN